MDIDLLQGRAKRYVLGPITKPQGGAYDLTSTRVHLMVKADMLDPDNEALIDYSISINGSGVPSGDTTNLYLGRPDPTNPATQINTTAAEGYVTVEFLATDTAGLSQDAKFWEVVLVDANSRPHQLRAGKFTVTDTLIETP